MDIFVKVFQRLYVCMSNDYNTWEWNFWATENTYLTLVYSVKQFS